MLHLLLLLLLSHFSCVRLCVTPQMAAHQVPPSLGFSRQEPWSGLPFPSPTHAKSLQSCPTPCDPMDSSPPAPLSIGFSRQEYWSGLPFPSPSSFAINCIMELPIRYYGKALHRKISGNKCSKNNIIKSHCFTIPNKIMVL